jgi:hypothetical protein
MSISRCVTGDIFCGTTNWLTIDSCTGHYNKTNYLDAGAGFVTGGDPSPRPAPRPPPPPPPTRPSPVIEAADDALWGK